jgi:hypothetical protein
VRCCVVQHIVSVERHGRDRECGQQEWIPQRTKGQTVRDHLGVHLSAAADLGIFPAVDLVLFEHCHWQAPPSRSGMERWTPTHTLWRPPSSPHPCGYRKIVGLSCVLNSSSVETQQRMTSALSSERAFDWCCDRLAQDPVLAPGWFWLE